MMSYVCFEVVEDEDNNVCSQCVKEELYNFLIEKKLLKLKISFRRDKKDEF
jgi:hypothetical protein